MAKSPDDLCKVHKNYIQRSHQLAVEHRYVHEYGDIAPEPPKMPKLSNAAPSTRSPKGSRTEQIKPTQAAEMKNKFEQALQSASQSSTSVSMSGDSGLPRERLVARVMPQQQTVEAATVTANTVGKMLKTEGMLDMDK